MDDQTLSSYFLGGRGPSGSKLKKGFETVSNSIVAKSIQRGKCVIRVDKTWLSGGEGIREFCDSSRLIYLPRCQLIRPMPIWGHQELYLTSVMAVCGCIGELGCKVLFEPPTHSCKKCFCLREPVFWGGIFLILMMNFPNLEEDFPNIEEKFS